MQDQEITDLIQDLESVGLSPTTEEMLKELKKDYEVKEARVTELKKHVFDDYTVKKTLTLEQLEEVLTEVNDLRAKATVKRESWQFKFIREGQEKIDELIPILGKEEGVYWRGNTRKSTIKKWYSEAVNTLREESEKKSANSFWSTTYGMVDIITKRIDECKKAKAENEAKSKLWEEFQWCKAKLISMGKITEKTAEHLSTTSIIDLAHAVLKEQHTIENGLTGEKCYCESHDENRHYHFSDSYWDGKEVQVYTNSETY
jgi:hypothetical protein